MFHGFIWRGSTEENESQNKKLKHGFNFTKKKTSRCQVDTISPQLLRAHFHFDDDVSNLSDSDLDNSEHDLLSNNDSLQSSNAAGENSVKVAQIWDFMRLKAINIAWSLNWGNNTTKLYRICYIKNRRQASNRFLWRLARGMKLLSSNVKFAKQLRHKTVFAGDWVYGKMNSHDAIEYMKERQE